MRVEVHISDDMAEFESSTCGDVFQRFVLIIEDIIAGIDNQPVVVAVAMRIECYLLLCSTRSTEKRIRQVMTLTFTPTRVVVGMRV